MILRQLLSDNTSLQGYLRGELPTEKEILRSLFVAERNTNPALPDHIPRNQRDRLFHRDESLSLIIWKGYKCLSDEHLEITGRHVHVRFKAFSHWQELLPWMPPLPLLAFALQQQWRLSAERSPHLLRNYIEDHILANSGFTALVTPFIPELQALLHQEKGLSDLHIHLNGITEVDHVWLYSLENSSACYREQRDILNSSELTAELYEQLEPGLTSKKVYDRLRLAGWLRRKMVGFLFGDELLRKSDVLNILNLSTMPFTRNEFHVMSRHPLRELLGATGIPFSSLQLETLFYVAAFQELGCQKEPDSPFASMFHCYLLLLGFFNKLVVQQQTQFGFDQFQKITLNEARAASEKHYERRFRQLMGNDRSHLGFIEGRFAPKATVTANRKLLSSILKGFSQATEKCFNKDRLELRLVAHFIKAPDTGATEFKVRHHSLRLDLEKKAHALLATRDGDPTIRPYLAGIDAASNEMDAGPEVFAPVYRLLRRRGFNHFTFHAGEDFIHLVSGMRYLYESIRFLDLRCGDRIGHATAVGIDPKLWRERSGNCFVMSKQQWLDDLLFAHTLLVAAFHPLVNTLEEKIHTLSWEIYRTTHPVAIYKKAWQMRHLDPLIAFDTAIAEQSDKLRFEDQSEWQLVGDARNENEAAFDIFKKYHSQDCCSRGRKLVEVEDVFSEESLVALQRFILAELHDNGIVIETMPTSNVRISCYQNHREHHIWRWLGMNPRFSGEKKPNLCIGSDDPGIFATHIVNEYSHIYQGLVEGHGCSGVEASNVLRRLAGNAQMFRFSPACIHPQPHFELLGEKG